MATTTEKPTTNKRDSASFSKKESIVKMVVVVGQITTKKKLKITYQIFGRLFFLSYICPIKQYNNMEQLFNECARRDLQMMLNLISPKHTEILVGLKTITIEGITMPEFTPMQICKN